MGCVRRVGLLSILRQGGVFITTCLVVLCLLPLGYAQAGTLQQVGLSIQRNEIELNFPNGLTFHLEADAPGEAQKVYLNYGTNGRACLQGISRQAIDIEVGTEIAASWEWDFTQRGSLPPGVEIWWEWEVLLSSGESLVTERMSYTLEDPRFDWKTVNNERIDVHWTEGSNAFGAQILDIARRSLERLEEQTGVILLEKIRLTVYPDSTDIQTAIMHLPEWAGGISDARFNLAILGIPADALDWADEIIPHEIAHLVIGMRTFNCMGIDLPTWLSEGIATLAEGDLSPEEHQMLFDKLTEGSLPGLITLTSGFSANAGEARLSYTQSAAAVGYLLETYGPQKFDELLGVIQGGKNADSALLQVYGLDTSDIDQAWRASLGFGTAPQQQEKTATLPPTQIPTRALWTAAVNLTATPTVTPSPTTTPAPNPATATPTPPQPPISSPTSTPAPESGSPLRCLGGVLLGVFSPLGLIMILFYRFRAVHR